MSSESDSIRVFLCHSAEDKASVRDLHRRLSATGIDVWLDEIKLLPGQDWDLEILKAVQSSHVVIICLSRSSVKKVGYVQTEIRRALDMAERQPEGSIFLIPLRLDDCEVPQRFRRWHWVDFFCPDGFEKLLGAIRVRSEELGIPLLAISQLLASVRHAIKRAAYEDIIAAATLVDPVILPLGSLWELTEALNLAHSNVEPTSSAFFNGLSMLVKYYGRLRVLLPDDVMVRLKELIFKSKFAKDLYLAEKYQEVIEELESVVSGSLLPAYHSQWRASLAFAYMCYASALAHLQRYQEVVEFADQKLDSLPLEEYTSLSCWILITAIKVESLESLGNPERAAKAVGEMLECCRCSSDVMQASNALEKGALHLFQTKRYRSAIPLLEFILATTRDNETQEAKELTARTYYKLAKCRRQIEEYEAAIATSREFLERFAVWETPDIESSVAWGMTELERSLRKTKRFDEAAQVSQQAFDRFGDSETRETRSAAAYAYAEMSAAHEGLGDYRGAVNYCEKFFAYFDRPGMAPVTIEHELSEQISWTFNEKAYCLRMLGQHEDAIAVCDELIERFGSSSNLDVQYELAWCLTEKAYNLRKSGCVEKALSVYKSMIARFSDYHRDDIQGEVRAGLHGVGFCHLHQARQALSDGNKEKAKSLIEESENSLVKANNMKRKAATLGSLGYIAFLREDLAVVHDLLAEAYALEGEEWRKEELGNVADLILPQDQAFIDILGALATPDRSPI